MAAVIAADTTLNSNLILLILQQEIEHGFDAGFFKFQSDSINTRNEAIAFHTVLTLNSNLILLILDSTEKTIILTHTLNSNLILLILR